jgi:hypothetical protein
MQFESDKNAREKFWIYINKMWKLTKFDKTGQIYLFVKLKFN